MYRVDLSSRAEKDLDRLPPRTAERVIAVLRRLGENPRPSRTTKLAALQGYRVRVVGYRVLYDIDDAAQVVTVYRVGHRREAYRQR